MAAGRSINKSYHSQMEVGGSSPQIEMPPLPEQVLPQQVATVPVQAEQPAVYQNFFDDIHPKDAQIEQPVVDNLQVSAESAENEEIAQEDEDVEEVVVAKDPKESFRDIRYAKEKAERERDALMSKMLELQSQQLNKTNSQVEEPDDLDLDIDPDTLLEGKHLNKYVKQMKDMKRELKDYKAQSKELVMERKLNSQYPDFNVVLNADSVTALNEKHPAIAKALAAIPDDYDKAVAAYEMIKNLRLNAQEDTMKKRPVDTDKAKALVNAAKPRPLASVSPQQGDSPLSKANAFANGLTDDLRDQLRKEMEQARRNH